MKFATCSLALLLSGGGGLSSASTWDPGSYNPQPLVDDLILPMPCAGAMVFRRVNVPSGGSLDDEPIHLGSHRIEHGYAEYRRKVWIAGSFTDTKGAGRHYFMGKYEVSAMQYRSLIDGCRPGGGDLELPATRISWAEAMSFAERYSEWLVMNAVDRVPIEDGAVGFLRLPTEAEWEFAARGGTRVSASQFAAVTFVPSGALDEYVVHDGNSYKELNVIGTLKPNPLGIHDILGNAAELVLEPFRLDAVGRLHGQAGGFVLRGGSYRARPAEIRISRREEYPPVDRHGIRRLGTAGFRLALVAPALPSRKSVQSVRDAWEARQRQSVRAKPDPGAHLAREQADPVAEARALAAAAGGEEIRRRLQNLATVIAENVRARKEERQRAAQESLSNAVFAARRAALDIGILDRWSRLVSTTEDPDRRARYQRRYEENQENYAFNLRYYFDQLTTIDQDYGDAALSLRADVLKGIYADQGLVHLPPITDRVIEHVARIRELGPAAHPEIIRSLTAMTPHEND